MPPGESGLRPSSPESLSLSKSKSKLFLLSGLKDSLRKTVPSAGAQSSVRSDSLAVSGRPGRHLSVNSRSLAKSFAGDICSAARPIPAAGRLESNSPLSLRWTLLSFRAWSPSFAFSGMDSRDNNREESGISFLAKRTPRFFEEKSLIEEFS